MEKWIICPLLCVFILVGCYLFDEGVSGGEAQFELSLAYPAAAGYTVTSVHVKLTHQPSGAIVEKDLSVNAAAETATGTITDLRVGTWDVFVELFENTTSIGSGTGTVMVTASAISEVNINIDLTTGDARITVDWSALGPEIGSWSTVDTLTEGGAGIIYNDYIYLIRKESVQYAAIAADGSLGVWNTDTSFTIARDTFAHAAYNGYLYVLGGAISDNPFDVVEYAPINSDGSLGVWNSTTSFVTARWGPRSVVYNGFLYLLGGGIGYTTSSSFSDVQYASINADGTLGTWNSTTPFTGGRRVHNSIVHNGYVYVSGGRVEVGGQYDDVQYAPINADGTLGTWSYATSFPDATKDGHSSTVHNGYLYVTGGTTCCSWRILDSVLYSKINSDGSLGLWNTATNLASARAGHLSFVYKDHLYVVAGGTLSGPVNDMQYALFVR